MASTRLPADDNDDDAEADDDAKRKTHAAAVITDNSHVVVLNPRHSGIMGACVSFFFFSKMMYI